MLANMGETVTCPGRERYLHYLMSDYAWPGVRSKR